MFVEVTGETPYLEQGQMLLRNEANLVEFFHIMLL